MREEMDEEHCKVVLVGNVGVGKTSIIKVYVNNEKIGNEQPTVNATYSKKIIEFENKNKKVQLDIWDTAGTEAYRSLASMYYRDAQVCILVFDISNSVTLEALKNYWIKEVRDKAPKEIILAIAANKSDIIEGALCTELGEAFAKKERVIFKLVSAFNNSGLDELFTELASEYLKSKEKNEVNEDEKEGNEEKKEGNEEKKEGNEEKNGGKKLKLKAEKDNGNIKKEKKCC